MEKDKKVLFQAGSLFLLVASVMLIYVVFWGALSGSATYPHRTMSVEATGKTTAVPDVATISYSVIKEGKDTKQIASDSNDLINKTIAYLKDQGVDPADITTTDYTLTPVYTQQTWNSSLNSFVPSIASYSLTQTVAVKVRDFSKISSFVDALSTMGINRVNGIMFSLDDPTKAQDTARADAITKAQEKAQAIAHAAGFSLGNVVSINEYNQPQPYMQTAKTFGPGGLVAAAPSSAPTIEPGSQQVTVTVDMVYEIR